jgi:hypothetical protein
MTTLADLEIGNPKTVLNLTAVPLSGNPASALEYLLIDEALEDEEGCRRGGKREGRSQSCG